MRHTLDPKMGRPLVFERHLVLVRVPEFRVRALARGVGGWAKFE
jgi:hypothetical protein